MGQIFNCSISSTHYSVFEVGKMLEKLFLEVDKYQNRIRV